MRLLEPFVIAALATGLVASTELAARADMASYRVDQWPQDIGKVPCEAWHKNGDGSWKQVAFIQAGAMIISGKNFGPSSGEALMLNAKCHQ